MAKAAMNTSSKVMKTCPKCGSKEPKELVGEGKRSLLGWLIAFCTMGIWLLISKPSTRLMAYCSSCGTTFNP